MPDPFADAIPPIVEEAQLAAAAVAVHDFASGAAWHVNGDRWFHAASTIKVAILVALAAAIDQGRFQLASRLAVRNRFLSAAGGSPFRIAPSRDANADVHRSIGRAIRLDELALHMIATSSNLATNLLLDLVGVEDDRAFAAGTNNRVTARGLVQLFRAIQERRAVPDRGTSWMLEILHQQQFTSGIPAGLPVTVRAESRIANKTGEISNMAHDAGLVFLPDDSVFAIAVLTETPAGVSPELDTVAKLARIGYERVIAARS
jgi:beta-lactamase class A